MRSLGERVGGGTASFLEFFFRNKKNPHDKICGTAEGSGEKRCCLSLLNSRRVLMYSVK